MPDVNIDDLNTEDIVVPDGYKVIIDPKLIEQERIEKEIAEIQNRLSQSLAPSIEELAELGKIYHPYYQDLLRLSILNGN